MPRHSCLNLHQITRQAIQIAQPDVSGLVFANQGQQVRADGTLIPIFAPGRLLNLQIQPRPAMQQLTEKLGFERLELAVYFNLDQLNALDAPNALPGPLGRYRPDQRGGDALYLPASQTWWQISGLLDGSAQSGWLCVLAVLQPGSPDFSACDWWTPEFEPDFISKQGPNQVTP